MLAGRIVRYVASGGVTTLVAYCSTMLFLRAMPYAPATVLAWLITIAVGFALNRRFTFGITGRDRRTRDLGLFIVGALMQLAITIAGYAVMLGHLGFNPTLAFAINLVLTTILGFAFLNLVAFRRAI